MGAKIIPPSRGIKLVEGEYSTLSTAKFFERISDVIADLPDEMAAISDVTLTAPSANEIALRDKINELLAALRSSGRLST